MSASDSHSFTVTRKWSIVALVALSIAAVLCISALVNYIATRHHSRFVWTTNPAVKLSPLTEQILQSLTNEVKVIVFYDPEAPLYSSVSTLLNEYEYRSSNLNLQHINPLLHASQAAQVTEKYDLTFGSDKNMVIFDGGEQFKVVYDQQLSEYDWSGLMKGESEVRRTGFKGELLFTSAILNVAEEKPRSAYFLQGHQELDPTSDDEQNGCLKLATVLRQNNISVDRLNLLYQEVPADCELLIVPAPKDPLMESELNKIDRFLHQGGRILALLSGQQTGLENILAKWGVDVGNDRVIDEQRMDGNGQILAVTNFNPHPIVKPLHNSRLLMLPPRSVERVEEGANAAEKDEVAHLARTSEHGRILTTRNDEYWARSPRDRRGEIPVIVAVEKGNIQGLQSDRGSTRLVIAGDSTFLGNQLIDVHPSNHDFAVFAVNWLLDRSYLLGEIGPRPFSEYKLFMTQAQMTAVRWLLLAGLPGAVLLVGVIVWYRRRH